MKFRIRGPPHSTAEIRYKTNPWCRKSLMGQEVASRFGRLATSGGLEPGTGKAHDQRGGLAPTSQTEVKTNPWNVSPLSSRE